MVFGYARVSIIKQSLALKLDTLLKKVFPKRHLQVQSSEHHGNKEELEQTFKICERRKPL